MDCVEQQVVHGGGGGWTHDGRERIDSAQSGKYMICSGDRVDRVGQCWCIGCNLRMWNI
jgi:hypothetical protein